MALTAAFAVGLLAFHGDGAEPPPPVAPEWHQPPTYGAGPYAEPTPQETPPLALEQVRRALADAYYRHVTPTLLAQPTIGAILKKLDDPYTVYLTSREYEELQERLARRYYGVGLTVGPVADGLVVTASAGGPAHEAGIRRGDLIVSIDGRSAAGQPFDRSLALIKGQEGTTVKLTIFRPGTDEHLRFEVERRPIVVPAVRSRLLRSGGKKIGYIRLLALAGDADVRVEAAARRLVARGAEGFILDLRGDPGGYLAQAVRVASLFIGKGAVCSTAGANQATRVFPVNGPAIETKRPMAVLVDRGTASAAEIVAGALGDHERAVVMGQRTYGKATVQSVIPLSNGGALKLTTASYLTPSGKAIGGKGIRPRTRVVDDPATRPDEAVVSARASVLAELTK